MSEKKVVLELDEQEYQTLIEELGKIPAMFVMKLISALNQKRAEYLQEKNQPPSQ